MSERRIKKIERIDAVRYKIIRDYLDEDENKPVFHVVEVDDKTAIMLTRIEQLIGALNRVSNTLEDLLSTIHKIASKLGVS